MSKSRVAPTRELATRIDAEWEVDGDVLVHSPPEHGNCVRITHVGFGDEIIYVSRNGVTDLIAALKAARDWTGE